MAHDVAKWLYRLDGSFAWASPFDFDRDRAFADATGRVRLVLEPGGTITVTRGYAWNGCSPKFRLLDLLVGTPEGVVNARTGQRKTYYASLVHDALYQFLGDGLPLSRAQCDRAFLLLMRESGFRLAGIYWLAVRAFGGVVHAATRGHRRWRGTEVRIASDAAAPRVPDVPASPPHLAGTRQDGLGRAPSPAMAVASVDHFVLTVADVEASVRFYEDALGMRSETFAGGRRALRFGAQKINLHPSGNEYAPHAARPTRGSGDFCLLADVPLDDVIAHLRERGIAIEEGPVARTGATGPIRSVYFRDPDGNLVEVARPAEAQAG